MRAVSLDRRATLYGLALVAVIHPLWAGRWFPTASGTVGHDFAGTLPAWLEGAWWFRENGLLPAPWFTPAFCGGVPLYADPQSGFYSLPQLLAFVVDPVRAAWIATSGLALLGYLGMVRLARDVAGLGGVLAALAGVVWAFQDFHLARMITGQFGFHGFVLAPWAAWALWHPTERALGPLRAGGNSVGAGVLFAVWLHGGLGTLLVPTGLALLALAPALPGASLPRFVARSVGAVAVALALCAAKLVASMSFLARFPREDYQLPGFEGLPTALVAAAAGVFAPSQWTWALTDPALVNSQWKVEPHEWAYGLGLPAAALLLAGLRRRPAAAPLAWLALFLPALLAVALLVWTPAWNTFLKSLPIVGQTSFPFRWLIVFLPVVCLGAARAAVGLPAWVAAVAAVATVGQHLLQPADFYDAQAFYDPAPVVEAWQSPAPPVTEVVDREERAATLGVGYGPNDWAVQGGTAIRCYNPIFGYRLEHLPVGTLHPGPVDAIEGGVYNLKDPACYVFPDENGCRPGDQFGADRTADLAAFTHRRPYPFTRSEAQQVADVVTALALGLVGLAAALALRSPAASGPSSR